MTRLRDSRIGFRLAAAFAAVGRLLTAVVVVALSGIRSQGADTDELVADQQTIGEVLQVKYRAADFNGWQTAYAFDVVRGQVDALDDGQGNRKLFLDSIDAFRGELATIAGDPELAVHRAEIADIAEGFRLFVATDERVIDLYRDGTEASRLAATELVLGEELVLFERITQAADQLDQKVRAESAGLGERLRAAVAVTPLAVGTGKDLTVTVSAGCAVGRAGAVRQVVEAADVALYRAKAAGRNRIAVSDA